MSKILFWVGLIGLLPQVNASDSLDLEAPGGVWWRKKTQIIVYDKMVLPGPLLLTADEVILQAPIVTQGYSLDVETRALTLDPAASIVAFEGSPPTISDIPPEYLTPAAEGADGAGQGDNGAIGRTGYTGTAGMGAAVAPSEISLFAAQVDGVVHIDGRGQSGGQGGAGGKGQEGGKGGLGTKAESVLIFDSKHAGAGGRGGAFGPGGKGGRGGKGGLPVPVSFSTVTSVDTSQIRVGPGKGGAGGAPGMPGKHGEGGGKGPGDRTTFLFLHEDENEGADGKIGVTADDMPAWVRNLGVGSAGENGNLPPPSYWREKLERDEPLFSGSFANFEKQRFLVTSAWYEFHWLRMFELIFRTSIDLLFDDGGNANNDSLAKLLSQEIEIANLEVVTERWEKSFLEPLRAKIQWTEETQSPVRAKLVAIHAKAAVLHQTLRLVQKRGFFLSEEKAELQKTVRQLSFLRAGSLNLAIDTCGNYLREVLGTPGYAKYLRSRQNYFEVPVCRKAGEFLSENGVMLPIQLTGDLIPSASLDLFDKQLRINRAVEPVYKERTALHLVPQWWWKTFLDQLIPRAHASHYPVRVIVLDLNNSTLTAQQVQDFRPSETQSSALKTLGIHKGFLIPKEKISLQNLDRRLRELVQIR
jgi:hypothetical protein